MARVRAERLQLEYEALFALRYEHLISACNELLDRQFSKRPILLVYGLNAADLALQDEFSAIMCRPSDASVEKADFLVLEDKMDAIVERWTTHIQELLRKCVMEANVVSPKAAGIDPLELATTIFRFGKKDVRCNFFPIFAGGLECSFRRATPDLGRELSPYEKLVFAVGSERRINPFRDAGLKKTRVIAPNADVRAIIEMAGQDPDTVTVTKMDTLDLRWVTDDRVYGWRNAVSRPSFTDALRE